MSSIDWKFYYAPPDGISYTLLSNVQSFDFYEGRDGLQDSLRATTGSLNGTNPSALPTIEVGGIIRVNIGATQYKSFTVSDYVIDYGITSAMDMWSITFEGSLAQAGRVTTSCSWSAGTETRYAAEVAALATGVVTIDFSIGDPPPVETVSGQIIENESLLTVLQRIINTEQGRFNEGIFGQLYWFSQGTYPTAPTGLFTDGTVGSPSASDIIFSNVQFAGVAQNYFTEVVVSPVGDVEQTVGTAGRTLNLETYSNTSQDALDIAGYALATVNSSAKVPYQISCLYERQTNNTITSMYLDTLTQIILRGTTYLVLIVGRRITATPTETRFTFDLVDGQSVGFFRLDNTYFGILDQNKLS